VATVTPLGGGAVSALRSRWTALSGKLSGSFARMAIGRWFTRNPLRVKLVAAVLVLVALALVVIGTTSAYFTRQYMVQRTDSQLWATVQDIGAVRENPGVSLSYTLQDTAIGIIDGSGHWNVFDNPKVPPSELPAVINDPVALNRRLNQPYTVTAADGHTRWRVLAVPNGATPLVVAHDLSTVDSTLDRLVFVELLVGAAVLILLALAGAWMVRASLRPLVAIERTAAAIAGGDLTRRVPQLDPRTELGELSTALNTMLSQVETAFLARASSEARAVRSEERMRQFVADASHELRTPLTTIRGFAELYRQGAAGDPADVLRRIESEAGRMGLLVEDLLLLARLDEQRPLEFGRVDLVHLSHDAAEAARAVAPQRSITVRADTAEDGLVVVGDEARLRQVIGNLVGNAVVHTPSQTPVLIRVRAEDESTALLEVVDEGPGLTAEQAQRVFERFYRVDQARTRAAVPVGATGEPAVPHSGTGLGLAIVAALVAAHRGTVQVQTEPGAGATFQVRLPLAPRDTGS
jgi:two-component system, OmpR family, sensor kinase